MKTIILVTIMTWFFTYGVTYKTDDTYFCIAGILRDCEIPVKDKVMYGKECVQEILDKIKYEEFNEATK